MKLAFEKCGMVKTYNIYSCFMYCASFSANKLK